MRGAGRSRTQWAAGGRAGDSAGCSPAHLPHPAASSDPRAVQAVLPPPLPPPPLPAPCPGPREPERASSCRRASFARPRPRHRPCSSQSRAGTTPRPQPGPRAHPEPSPSLLHLQSPGCKIRTPRWLGWHSAEPGARPPPAETPAWDFGGYFGGLHHGIPDTSEPPGAAPSETKPTLCLRRLGRGRGMCKWGARPLPAPRQLCVWPPARTPGVPRSRRATATAWSDPPPKKNTPVTPEHASLLLLLLSSPKLEFWGTPPPKSSCLGTRALALFLRLRSPSPSQRCELSFFLPLTCLLSFYFLLIFVLPVKPGGCLCEGCQVGVHSLHPLSLH